MVSVSGLSPNVNKLAVSVWYDLVAPKPFSRVAISGSGRVSTSGSTGTSGATLIPRPSRARDLVTMAEVGSGRVTSLERVTTGVGSATGAKTKKLDSLGTTSRPSWLGLSLSIALLSNTGILLSEIPNYSGADFPLRQIQFPLQYKSNFAFTNQVYDVAVEEKRRLWSDQLSSTELDGNTPAMTATARALSPEALGARCRELFHAASTISRNPSRFT